MKEFDQSPRGYALGCFLTFWFWVALIVGLISLGVSLGTLTGLLKEIPANLTVPGPGGEPVPMWAYYLTVPFCLIVLVAVNAIYGRKNWGVALFSLAILGMGAAQLLAGFTWGESLRLLVWPAVLVLLAWPYLFKARGPDIPRAATLKGWEEGRR